MPEPPLTLNESCGYTIHLLCKLFTTLIWEYIIDDDIPHWNAGRGILRDDTLAIILVV